MSYLQEENSKMAAKTFNFLGSKTFSIHFLRRKRKISENASLEGDLSLQADPNCNFKLKRNKIRNSKLRKRIKLNLVKFRPEKRRAPHNTSTFLIENFRNTEANPEIVQTSLNFPQELNFSEISDDLEEICITGGTMKGKLNCNLSDLLLSEEFFLSSNSPQKDKDQISIYSTDLSLTDSEDKLATQQGETTFPYPLYEYS